MNILKSILLIIFSSCCCCHNREVRPMHSDNSFNSPGWGYFIDSAKVDPGSDTLKIENFIPAYLDTINGFDTTYWRHVTDSIENQVWIEEHVKSI